MEGKFANWVRTFGKDVDPSTYLRNLSDYASVDYSGNLIHPLHRTEADKQLRQLRRRLKNAKRESTKERLQLMIKEITDEQRK